MTGQETIDDDPTVIAVIPRPRGEELRITRQTFHDQLQCSIRIWFEADDGTMKAGRQGINFKPELLDEIIAGLTKLSGALQKDRRKIEGQL